MLFLQFAGANTTQHQLNPPKPDPGGQSNTTAPPKRPVLVAHTRRHNGSADTSFTAHRLLTSWPA
jgi:hypothetical protein